MSSGIGKFFRTLKTLIPSILFMGSLAPVIAQIVGNKSIVETSWSIWVPAGIVLGQEITQGTL